MRQSRCRGTGDRQRFTPRAASAIPSPDPGRAGPGRLRQRNAAMRRGIQRGDLPDDLDTDLVQDIWAGTILYRRLMTGSPLDTDLAEHLVQLVTNNPPLLSHREAGARPVTDR
ncbi:MULTISPECIES: TetR/AcrR family transcriptional regulator C-terminal ligand-binding domain-containing protein [Streptomyces]|uniref:TetR/AcrR family transcriptional regulator C-terminal ligand-binding domain-containing protein n=1 Tax=Streptomyces TaxID=1883 RepID=UPI00211E68B7|nr:MULTISPECIES: TetR/AcrR family transcriptional regulator C-terminal ligand-binding domain-containing protein [Streptomyces]